MLAVVLGHCFPIWLKFKGGKGVATTFGSWIGLNPVFGLFALVLWLLTAVISRRSSLAALTSIALSAITFTFFEFNIPERVSYPLISAIWIVSVLVFIRHHENIKRLLAGTEPKIGQKK